MIEIFLLLCAVLMLIFICVGCGLSVYLKQQMALSISAQIATERTLKETKELIDSIRTAHNGLMHKFEDTDKRVNDLKFAVEMNRKLGAVR